MRSTIDRLVQLQELTLIRDEQRSLHGAGADLTSLNERIDGMIQELDPAVKAIYLRLSKKDHVIIAPLHEGKCSMCGMSIAISQVQSVKQCRTLVACPSCARILYDPSGVKWLAERPKRSSGERKTGLARFSSPALMLPHLKAKSAAEAVAELANALEREKLVDDAATLAKLAMDREAPVSTNVGRGLAFPHVRGIEGGALTLVFGTSEAGIKWGAGDEDPVNFVFFSTIPTAASSFYLKILAGLVDPFSKDVNRKAALAAETPDALWKALTKATRYSIK